MKLDRATRAELSGSDGRSLTAVSFWREYAPANSFSAHTMGSGYRPGFSIDRDDRKAPDPIIERNVNRVRQRNLRRANPEYVARDHAARAKRKRQPWAERADNPKRRKALSLAEAMHVRSVS